jgi:hypothetical protein
VNCEEVKIACSNIFSDVSNNLCKSDLVNVANDDKEEIKANVINNLNKDHKVLLLSDSHGRG